MLDKDTILKRISLRKKRFAKAEDGAVTVDWVVLTAAAVGMAAGAGTSISDAVTTLGESVEAAVSGKTVNNGD